MESRYRKIQRYVFSKDFFIAAVVIAILLPIFWYMLWASTVSHQTILIGTFPEFTIYITVGAIIGLLFAARATWWRPVNKTPKHIFDMFGMGFCCGFVATLNIFDVYVYLFPEKTIHYLSDYQVSFPGPSRGKYSHCEAGLWIKDQHTARWHQLCTNKAALAHNRKQGMDAVWVTARVNKLGSYIVSYQFTYR